MPTRPLIIAALLLLSLPRGEAQNRVARLERHFSALAANGAFNGGVLVAERGTVRFRKTTGYADFSRSVPLAAGTRFPLASLSKTITATAVLQLAEAGKLSVSDPVARHLPGFPYPDIRIRHLLSHTSGLPPYNAYLDSLRSAHPDTSFGNADFRAVLLKAPRPLLYAPGAKANYDNVNYLLLALLIEQVAGEPYRTYIGRHILKPARMTQTLLLPFRQQYNASAPLPFAYPHLYPYKFSDSLVRAKDVTYIARYWRTYNFSGFGDLVSTLRDLLRYDEALYNGRLLKRETLEEAFQPVPLNDGSLPPTRFGLGWQVGSDSTYGRVVYHNGNATGLSCILLRNISRKQTVIVFDNVHADNAQPLAFEALRLLNGDAVPLPRKSAAAEYVRLLLHAGCLPARARLRALQADSLRYYLSENELNDIGYDLMGGPNNPNPYRFAEVRRYPEALELFRLVAELFPGSWNAHDSYGEILLLLGRTAEATEEYRRSVQLNPRNEGGKKALERLTRQ
ncbi:MAG: serine hydrolase [Chitinophagaceae bacterium]|nr:MAG: serine hydrolase [Chitinophagaceae bacterium]